MFSWALLCLVGAIAALARAAMAQPVPAAAIPELNSDTELATAGFYRLSWDGPAAHVELQESADPGFRHPITAYAGPDRATVISGKSDGTWYYRLRVVAEPGAGSWSEPVAVVVTHHSLPRALTFLGLGVVVFVAVVLLVVRGARTTQ